MRLLTFAALMLLGFPCLAADLPDPALTPGAINPDLTAEKLCAKGFTTKDYRHTSTALKAEIYREYGITPHQGICAGPEGCEVDHLCSLELGCADVKENLWVQPYSGTPWNAHVKDRYENFLHAQVCSGKMKLSDAQAEIITNWIVGYKKHPELPKVDDAK